MIAVIILMNTFIHHTWQIQSNNKTIKYQKRKKRNNTIKMTTYIN